jgi:gamma-glutamyltranspeptidase/glutathione hydrolase
VWQAISNVLDFKKSVAAAIALPRLHQQHLPDKLFIEDDSVTKETDDKLKALGYATDYSQGTRFGAANAIVRTPAGWEGAADPRGGGAAMGD